MDRKKRNFTIFALLIVLSFSMMSSVIYAKRLTVNGDWQTIDHQTNRPSSIIRIWEQDGKYYGKVVKSYRENGHKPTDRCEACKGKLHNRRILGMTILSNFVERNPGKYVNGRVLDPTSGKTYHCRMTLVDNGQRLKVRGYIGFPLLGRTDVWRRVSR